MPPWWLKHNVRWLVCAWRCFERLFGSVLLDEASIVLGSVWIVSVVDPGPDAPAFAVCDVADTSVVGVIDSGDVVAGSGVRKSDHVGGSWVSAGVSGTILPGPHASLVAITAEVGRSAVAVGLFPAKLELLVLVLAVVHLLVWLVVEGVLVALNAPLRVAALASVVSWCDSAVEDLLGVLHALILSHLIPGGLEHHVESSGEVVQVADEAKDLSVVEIVSAGFWVHGDKSVIEHTLHVSWVGEGVVSVVNEPLHRAGAWAA